MSKKKDLVQIIRENPGSIAIIDNDCWTLYKKPPDNSDPNDEDEWEELASYEDVISLGDGGYGSGNCYGGDVLQALAVIAGIEVRSV